jgi:hypothetical protein
MKKHIEGFGFRIGCRLQTIRRPERILVIHIAKTAGTSLRSMLEDEYGSHMVYPGNFYLKNLPNGCYPLGSEMIRDYAKIPPHNVLVGHFTAAMADMLPKPYRTATFLRDPVHRSLSMLGHFSLTMNVTVTALIKDEVFMNANIADYQTRILGANGVCDPHQVGSINETVLARAIGRLDTLDFVGLTERFSESCQIFDKTFRTKISKCVRRNNILRSDNEFAEYIPQIKPFIKHDQVLYKTAQARLKVRTILPAPNHLLCCGTGFRH